MNKWYNENVFPRDITLSRNEATQGSSKSKFNSVETPQPVSQFGQLGRRSQGNGLI